MSVAMTFLQGDLFIDVTYNDETADNELRKRRIAFPRAVYFHKSSIPEPKELIRRKRKLSEEDAPRGRDEGIDGLRERRKSWIADAWTRHLSQSASFRHYVAYFPGNELVVEVVSRGVTVSGASRPTETD